MHRQALLSALADYAARWPAEATTLDYRQFVETEPRCFDRATVAGHVTGSAWVVDQSGGRALMLLHRKLGRWLQPGGHADGESDTLAVAMKEVEEEAGLTALTPFGGIFDLDIHPIPTRGAEPEHLHYDVRHALRLTGAQEARANHESTDLRWFDINEIAGWDEPSLSRMAVKWLSLSN